MGLLDMVTGAIGIGATGGTAGGGQLLDVVMKVLADPNNGGLQGLLKSFQDSGLGEQAASLVGTGVNLPISADQIRSALSDGPLGQIASQMGLSESDAAGSLGDLLPGLIDKLTPGGQMPEGDLLAQGMTLLKGGLFG